jgi:DNA-binding NarL/FixJ family response regulator
MAASLGDIVGDGRICYGASALGSRAGYVRASALGCLCRLRGRLEAGLETIERAAGSLLAVDDDGAFVAFVEALFASAGYRTLTATTGKAAIELAREEMPHVLLLDISLPDISGYEVCRALRDEFGRGIAIAFVSGTRKEPVDISSGLLVGADDYLTKPCEPTEFLARAGALVRRVQEHRREAGKEFGRLTGRESEILQLLANGRNQKQISVLLSIAPKTVGVHIEHILTKLDVHSRAEAVAAAYRGGRVDALTRSSRSNGSRSVNSKGQVS